MKNILLLLLLCAGCTAATTPPVTTGTNVVKYGDVTATAVPTPAPNFHDTFFNSGVFSIKDSTGATVPVTAGLVPYTGATGDVTLGAHNFTATTITATAHFVGDGSLLSNLPPGCDYTGATPMATSQAQSFTNGIATNTIVSKTGPGTGPVMIKTTADASTITLAPKSGTTQISVVDAGGDFIGLNANSTAPRIAFGSSDGTSATLEATGGTATLSTNSSIVLAPTTNTTTAQQIVSTLATGTAPFAVTSTTPVPNLSIGGNAATVTTNANLTGPITSVGNATSIASQSGTGTTFVMVTSPTLQSPALVTPALGTPASGNLTNCYFPTLNQSTTGNAATVTNGAYLNAANTFTLRNSFPSLTLDDGNDNSIAGLLSGPATTGSYNVFYGSQTGEGNTTGGGNTFIGSNAAVQNTTGYDNTYLGHDAGAAATTGFLNIIIGVDAGNIGPLTGNNNIFAGADAGTSEQSGSCNVYIGTASGLTDTTGLQNTYVGYESGRYITGSNNTFMGGSAAASAPGGAAALNVVIGQGADSSLTTGSGNLICGYMAGTANTTGSNNVYMGNASGLRATTAGDNICLGNNTGWSLITGANNTFIGFQAGMYSTGGGNVFIGNDAGQLQTTASNLGIIDNQSRSTAAAELTNAPIVINFNGTVASQTVTINAGHINASSLPTGVGTPPGGLNPGDLWVDTTAGAHQGIVKQY